MIPFEDFFWLLKRFFPGDTDFSIDKYWELPYTYVLLAVQRGLDAESRDRHLNELSTAQISSLLANQNRDPRKTPKPFSPIDFCFFSPKNSGSLPRGRYGAAARLLVLSKRMPPWGLFCFKELNQAATKGYEPEIAALMAEDAILLHPVKVAGGWEGMLIAQESASLQIREFTDDKGSKYRLKVPIVETKIVAKEDVTLPLL